MGMKITILWDMTPCIVVEESRPCGGPYCFHRQIRVDTLIIEVGGSSESRYGYVKLHGVIPQKTAVLLGIFNSLS
jgi:hypothetical protein